MNYQKALELNESREGLDLTEISNDDLVQLIDEIPGWDYLLGEESVRELARRAGIDTDAFFAESDRDYSDLWFAAIEALGYDEEEEETWYFLNDPADVDEIFGSNYPTCLDEAEIRRLSTEWGTDLMSKFHEATEAEIAEYGVSHD